MFVSDIANRRVFIFAPIAFNQFERRPPVAEKEIVEKAERDRVHGGETIRPWAARSESQPPQNAGPWSGPL